MQPTPSQQLLQEAVKQYGVGQGYKRRRSNYPKSTPSTFITSYIPKTGLDSRTKQPRQGGDITIPLNIRNGFKNFREGDFFQVQITNLQNQKSFVDIFKVDKRGRVSITQRQGHYIGYQKNTHIKVRIMRHLPVNMKEKLGPITTVASCTYNSKWGAVVWVSLPLPTKQLLGLEVNQKNREVHWKALGYEGTGKIYLKTQIGISPAKLGLKPEDQTFSMEFTVLNPNLSPQEALKINDISKERFFQDTLLPLQDSIDVQFTGKPQVDKPNLQKWWVKDMVKNEVRIFSEFTLVEEEKQIHLEDGRIAQPDLTLTRKKTGEKVNLEIKAVADGEILTNEKNLSQALKYKNTGHPLYYMTTAEKRNIAKELYQVPDKIITQTDLERIVKESENPLYREIFDLIRIRWP